MKVRRYLQSNIRYRMRLKARCASCKMIVGRNSLNANEECPICFKDEGDHRIKAKNISESEAIQEAISTFPIEFGLRAFPNATFRMSSRASYVHSGRIFLYVECKREGWWSLFTRATINEFRTQVLPLKDL